MAPQTKVREVVLDHLHRWDAEQIQQQHPDLKLAEIHSALAFYYDHQEDLDRQIKNGLSKVAEIRAAGYLADSRKVESQRAFPLSMGGDIADQFLGVQTVGFVLRGSGAALNSSLHA